MEISSINNNSSNIRFLILLILLITLTFSCDCKHLNKKSFNELVGSDKNLLIKFYAPWCKHCVALEPTWKSLAEVIKNDEQGSKLVVIARVDCTQEGDLCNQENVQGYPTIKIYNSNDNQGTEYEGPKDFNSLVELVRKQFNLAIDPQSLKTKSPSTLTDSILPSAIEKLDKELDKLLDTIGLGSGGDKKLEPADEGGEEEEELVSNRDKGEVVAENGLYELNDDNYESFLSTGRHFVKFFAPWCGHCQLLEPKWLKLASRFENENQVSISRIDCDQFKDACNKYGIKGYPTLLWIIDGVKIQKYDGTRQVDDLEQFVRSKVEEDQRKNSLRTEDLIVQVTDRNFKTTIKEGMTLIQFWAPWCAHCKRLSPVYESLANKLQKEQGNKGDKIVLGMMDCSKYDSLCSREGVDGYPTLNLYSNGRQIAEYEGERTVESMYKFLVKQVDNEMENSFKDEL